MSGSNHKLRYEALDSLRGICACMVVMFHFKADSHFVSASIIRHSYLFVDFFFCYAPEWAPVPASRFNFALLR